MHTCCCFWRGFSLNNDGTVFSITTGVAEKVLHGFAGSDGANSYAGLVNVKGTLYGTTVNGGLGNATYIAQGTVYKLLL